MPSSILVGIKPTPTETAAGLITDTYKVKVDANDQLPDFLIQKIIGGAGVVVEKTRDGKRLVIKLENPNPTINVNIDSITEDDINAIVYTQDTYETNKTYEWAEVSITNFYKRDDNTLATQALDNDETAEMTITANKTVQFYCELEASCEDYFDRFYYGLNGNLNKFITGHEKIQIGMTLKPGETYTFRFVKDPSLQGNNDAVYINDLTFIR